MELELRRRDGLEDGMSIPMAGVKWTVIRLLDGSEAG